MLAPELLIPISAWSRQHCVAICAGLVPANLITTITTLVLLVRSVRGESLYRNALFASSLAVVLCLHVTTWLVIGVVTPVTFILFSLGGTCLGVNLVAVWLRQSQPERGPQVARWAVQVVASRWSLRR
ncbi:MAG: hypothetical protein HC910_18570 [Spirulinaceae cyanobacterium SM2_1_0]|nr:hypothetical protein [Spirulinaceae cyanobacterium SM2_1_0]